MNTICPNCKMLVPYAARMAGKMATCPACHEPFEMPSPDEQARLIEQEGALKREQAQRFERARQRRVLPAEESRRYPTLWLLAVLLQFLAVAVPLLAVASIVALVMSTVGDEDRLVGIVVLVAVALLGPVLLWGLGELILLLIDLADDVRAARLELTRLRRKKG